MYFSKEYNFIYFAIPKTGSTSIARVLRDYFKAKCLRSSHDNIVPEEMKNYFKFTSTRNPYARAISCYYHIHRKRSDILPLNECWKKFHMISMTSYLDNKFYIDEYAKPYDDIEKYIQFQENSNIDAFIKLENLTKDFHNLPFVDKKVIFPVENTCERQFLNYSNICYKIPDELLDQSLNYYADDFLNFQYMKSIPINIKKTSKIII